MSEKKKKKRSGDEAARVILKKSSGFVWSLLVNVIIVFLVVKVFSWSFNFSYGVFGNVSKEPYSKEYVMVDIPADSSVMEIADALEDNGIIEDKYVFFAKVRVKNCANKIVAGKYGLSPSMTYGEIVETICPESEDEDTGKEE